MVDILNKLAKHQNIGNKVMDMVELSNVKTENDLKNWLQINRDDM